MATYYVELDGGQLQADAALKGGTMSAAASFSGAVIYPSQGGGGGGGSMQTKSVSYTPSESAISDAVTPDPGYDGLDRVNVSVDAISPTYVGSGITRRSSSDLSVSGATVTAPAGYYQNPAAKIIPSASNPYLSYAEIENDGDLYVDLEESAGYRQSGTLGLTLQNAFSVKSAQTYTPGTTDQTIASGQFLKGVQTILGDANLLPENIKKDVTIFGRVGTYEGGGGGEWDDTNKLLIAVIESGDAYGDFTFPGATSFHERVFADLGGSFTVASDDVLSIGQYAFYRSAGLTSLRVPNCTSIGGYALGGTTDTNQGIETLYAPNANLAGNCANGAKKLVTAVIKGTPSTGTRNWHFRNCTSLEVVDAVGLMYLDNSFNGATNMNTLILRRTTANTLANTGTFTGTPFASGGTGGTLYVPSNLISTYQNASNWSTILGYANNNIKSIESTHTDPTAPIDLTLYYVDGTPIPT